MKRVISILFLAVIIGGSLAIQKGTIDDVDKVIFYALPHSHTDAGWYWTYNYYYNLAKNILNSVTDYLSTHEHARFTWSDHSFFRKWFNEEVKGKGEKEGKVRELIKNGHLDLINGGLVQNDEASSHMKETYTNFEEGLKFLFEEFGIRPDAYWQLDPFGFSSISPEIYKSLGINKVIINRMSEAYKDVLRKNQDLDFIWQGDGEEEIWAHTLHGHYGMELDFYYDKRWYTDKKCPNPLDEPCVKKLVEECIHQGLKVHNRTGYVMQLLGNDFFFSDAYYSFDYIDGMKSSLEKYGSKFLSGKPVEFRYVTLSEYLRDMEKLKYEIGRYRGDFFVYSQYNPSDFYDQHWGGYFFSRPMFKWMVRDSLSSERLLHSMIATMNFVALTKETNLKNGELKNTFHTLMKAREYNPVMLHHDAITGTHGQAVNIDYKRILQNIHNNMDTATTKFLHNVQTLEILGKKQLEIVMYNPSFYTRNEIINITLPSEHWSFIEALHPDAEIMDSYKLNKEFFSQDKTEFILWMKVSLKPFAYEKVIIEKHDDHEKCQSGGKCIERVQIQHLGIPSTDLTVSNTLTEAKLGLNSLEIKQITDRESGQVLEVNEALYKYDGKDTKSCIYLFKPTSAAVKIHLRDQKFLKYTGKLIKGYQVYGHGNDIHFDKTILLKKDDPALHIVSRNFIKNQHDKEIAIRYNGYNANEFYSGNSMSYVNRKFIDLETAKNRNLTRQECSSDVDILGLNTYPLVDGFVSKKGGYIGFTPSHSSAVNLLSDSKFEFLIARSVMNINEDKGLPERLDERMMTHFNYKVFIKNDLDSIHRQSHTYGDQMVDPILIIINQKKVSDIPKITFEQTDNIGIDVISLRMFDESAPIHSPGMIRIRNRSPKPIRLGPILFSFETNHSDKGHLAILSSTKFGYSSAETLKNLNYKQKVSEDYNVRDDYNVLKKYRDDYVTIETQLQEILLISN